LKSAHSSYLLPPAAAGSRPARTGPGAEPGGPAEPLPPDAPQGYPDKWVLDQQGSDGETCPSGAPPLAREAGATAASGARVTRLRRLHGDSSGDASDPRPAPRPAHPGSPRRRRLPPDPVPRPSPRDAPGARPQWSQSCDPRADRPGS